MCLSPRLAIIGVRAGIGADSPAELHRDPVDVLGAVLATVTIVFALLAPTVFVNEGADSWLPWTAIAVAAFSAILFVLRENSARYPLLDLRLIARPLVSSGLAFKAAAGLATAGLSYLVTLQLQLDWGWPPALAALGMLPQVIVLLAAGPFVNPFVERVGINRAAWLSATAVVLGLAVYAALQQLRVRLGSDSWRHPIGLAVGVCRCGPGDVCPPAVFAQDGCRTTSKDASWSSKCRTHRRSGQHNSTDLAAGR